MEYIYIVTNDKSEWGYWFRDVKEANFKADFMNQTSSYKEDVFFVHKIKGEIIDE